MLQNVAPLHLKPLMHFIFFIHLAGNDKEKDGLAEGVRMQNLENKLSPVLQKYVNENLFKLKS